MAQCCIVLGLCYGPNVLPRPPGPPTPTQTHTHTHAHAHTHTHYIPLCRKRTLRPLKMCGLSLISVSIPLAAFMVKSGSSDRPVLDTTFMMKPRVVGCSENGKPSPTQKSQSKTTVNSLTPEMWPPQYSGHFENKFPPEMRPSL